MKLYHKIMSQNYIMGSYYGIISWNHLYEEDPGDAGDIHRARWDPGDPLGTPLGPPGTLPGSSGHAPVTPRERP